MNININKRDNLFVTDYEFLSAFKDPNEFVYFRLIKETEKGVSFSHVCKFTNTDEDEYPLMKRLFKKHQKEGFGIFFVINGGGTKKQSINKITAQFLDLDYGKVPKIQDNKIVKDENNKIIYEFRSEDEIENYKKNFLVNLCKFKLHPNIINETKNGFHVYWLLDRSKPQDISLFTPVQEQLVNYFSNLETRKEHVDPSVSSPERVLRVAGYMHLKNPSTPFLIKCIYFNTAIRHTQEDIITALNADISYLKSKINEKIKKDNKKLKPTVEISKLNIKTYNKSTLTEIDFRDIFHFFRKEIDLRDFLGINVELGQKFNCILHEDKSPSANISKFSDGSYRYFCNSTKCLHYNPHGLDIVDLVKIQNNYDTQKALKYLLDLYKIKIVDTEWLQKEILKYDRNIEILDNTQEFKLLYPYTKRLIKYGYSVALELLFTAKDSIQNKFFEFEGNSVFFISNRYLSKKLKKNLTRTNQYVNLLCVLGLVIKIPTDNVPKPMLKRAKEIAKSEGFNRISFYTIPSFSDVLDTAEIKAKLMIECKFTINSMSKVYVENLLGTEFANKTYHVPIKDTEERKQIRDKLENIAMVNIASIGFTTKDIILNEKIFIGNKFINYATRKYELNRIIPDLIQKYDLIYIKPNKIIKVKLGINTNKYIFIQSKILN